MNDTTTPNFLQPTLVAGLTNDRELRRFLNQLISGITGLDSKLVYPMWQTEPAAEPPFGTDWVSTGVESKKDDVFAFEGHVPEVIAASGTTFNEGGYGYGGYGATSVDQPAYNYVLRTQELTIIIKLFGPNSEMYCDKLTMGLQLSHNLQAMTRAGMALIETTEPITVPDYKNSRWQYAVHLRMRLRRTQVMKYNVLSYELDNVIIYFDDPVTSVTIPIAGGSVINGG